MQYRNVSQLCKLMTRNGAQFIFVCCLCRVFIPNFGPAPSRCCFLYIGCDFLGVFVRKVNAAIAVFDDTAAALWAGFALFDYQSLVFGKSIFRHRMTHGLAIALADVPLLYLLGMTVTIRDGRRGFAVAPTETLLLNKRLDGG